MIHLRPFGPRRPGRPLLRHLSILAIASIKWHKQIQAPQSDRLPDITYLPNGFAARNRKSSVFVTGKSRNDDCPRAKTHAKAVKKCRK